MLRNTLFLHCERSISKTLKDFKNREKDLLLAIGSENKGSAGEKHETGLAMIQLEREKLGDQLKKVEQFQNLLTPLKIYKKSNNIILGSVVITNYLSYYISFPASPCTIRTKTYYCISAQSPIGSLLLGKKVGDQITFNNKISIIEGVH